MPELLLGQALRAAVAEILETMFFVCDLEEVPTEMREGSAVAAELSFAGSPSGRLALSMDAGLARSFAADFLGEDAAEISAEQVREVVCELANMICGSVLSQVESEHCFRLSTPRFRADGPACQAEGGPVLYTARIGGAGLRVEIGTEEVECPAIAESGS